MEKSDELSKVEQWKNYFNCQFDGYLSQVSIDRFTKVTIRNDKLRKCIPHVRAQ